MCKVPLAGTNYTVGLDSGTITNIDRRRPMAGTSYKGSEIKSVDQFIKDKAGLSSAAKRKSASTSATATM